MNLASISPRLFASVLLVAAVVIAGPVQADDHSDKAMKNANIVKVARNAGQFETLLTAAKAAGLVGTLSGKGPLTVFAPTDDAFAALPDGTVDSLLQPENRDQLRAILTYHVVSGKVMAADVMGMDSAETVNGESIQISTTDGNVMIDGATVIKADVEASNGVIHVIDKVLMPGS